jgi:hypothetical protein
MSYSIGGTNVNGGVEKPEAWRQIATFPSKLRTETFPGSGVRYVTIDDPLPDGVVVEGWLSADNIGALDTLLKAEAARRYDTTPRTVAINGASYANQYLAGFQVISEITAFADGGSTKVAAKVRYTWIGVTP